MPFIIGRCQHASKEATKSLDFEVHWHSADFLIARTAKTIAASKQRRNAIATNVKQAS